MDCDAEPLFTDGPRTLFRAHRGMATAARWIVAETAEVVAMAVKTVKKPRVTVLGHSLGAGTAALTAAIMRQNIPTLRCVAFATPPCLEFDAAESCAPFLTSVVLHDDVVSRASLANVQDLRARLQAIDWRASFEKDFEKDWPRLQSAKRAVGGGADKMGEAMESLQKRTAAAAEKGAAFAAAAAAKLFSKGGEGGGGKVGKVAGAAADAASGAANAAAAAAGSLASRFGASLGLGGAKSSAPAAAADASPPPPLFVPGRVFHLRRDVAGAGASSALVSRHVGTLARVELSSSLVADHSLCEYAEALETLSLRAAKKSPRTEVSWRARVARGEPARRPPEPERPAGRGARRARGFRPDRRDRHGRRCGVRGDAKRGEGRREGSAREKRQPLD
jgi:sn1-specific diacylglycerol lipase